MYLERIDSPQDVNRLSVPELEKLAEEIREAIIEVVLGKTGGHFAPNLGTVELTLALHYVFDSPRDKIVWDVGHQAYPHKLVTGRRDRFHTIRQEGGLSGFLQREESPHDHFGKLFEFGYAQSLDVLWTVDPFQIHRIPPHRNRPVRHRNTGSGAGHADRNREADRRQNARADPANETGRREPSSPGGVRRARLIHWL
jgi:hypothetical protein